MTTESNQTHAENLAANQRGIITEAQRRAAARLDWGPFGGYVLFSLLVGLIVVAGTVSAWQATSQPAWLALAALVAFLTLAGLSLYALWLWRTTRLKHKDLGAGLVRAAEGRVQWQGSRYVATFPDQPRWASNMVRGVLAGPHRIYYLPRSGYVLSAERLRPGEMVTATTPLPKPTVARAIEFTDSDLARNYAGQLSDQQARLLRRIVISNAVGLLLVWAIAAFFIWITYSRPVGGHVPLGAFVALTIYISIRNTRLIYNSLRDLRQGAVSHTTGSIGQDFGRIAFSVSGHSIPVAEPVITINGQRLSIPHTLNFELIVPGAEYRVYYSPYSKRVVALERTGGRHRDSLPDDEDDVSR